MYAPGEGQGAEVAVEAGPGFLSRHPFYARASARCKIEGVSVGIEAVHGASGFDDAGNAVTVAAKLARRIGPEKISLDRNAPCLSTNQDMAPGTNVGCLFQQIILRSPDLR
ncbi:MAG: hypothetical protein FWB78_10195 [Treponema sp.]|nr:hypothetical protein [Treponema sp.]